MHNSATVSNAWPRRIPTIAINTTTTHATDPKILVIPSSSFCRGERCRWVEVTIFAIRPISVLDPVAVTATVAVPRVTCVFWNTRFVRSPSAVPASSTLVPSLATGALSPVRADSWSSNVADVTMRPSAGTTSPASSNTTSPGTSCVDSTSSTAPPRRTRACGTCRCASASTLARAFSSWLDAITTLNVTSPSTKMPVGICPTTKLRTATIISMMFIGFVSCPRATTHRLGGGSFGSSLGPYLLRRSSTSVPSSPRLGSTPSCAAASPAGTLYQVGSGVVPIVVVIAAGSEPMPG